jgi:hypothetical protein
MAERLSQEGYSVKTEAALKRYDEWNGKVVR